MRLSDIVTILKNTELKQIIIGEDDDQIISLLNMALIDVYGRFNILQEEQVITLVAGKTRYNLQNNLQRVLQVYAKTDPQNDKHEEIPINDINDDRSVFTPQPYILHVPNPVDATEISVMLSVTPPWVTRANIDTVDFVIPPQLMEPIVNYVGYRAYISMNGDEATESTAHYKRYSRSVNDVEKRGLVHYSILTNTKTTDRGFA